MSQAPAQQAPKLNLRRLESIQRLLQYGAVVVLLVFFALIALAWFQLRGLNTKIEARKNELIEVEKKYEEKQTELAHKLKEIDTLQNLNGVLTNVSRAYTEEHPAEAQKVRDAVEQSIAQSVAQNSGQAVKGVQVPPRIYIHIIGEAQRARAGEAARQLQAKGFVVPGIENVQGKARPQAVSDVRYYKNNEASQQDVENISSVLAGFGVRLKPISLAPSGNARPRHYEVWFGNDFSPAPTDSPDKPPLRVVPDTSRPQRETPSRPRDGQ
jgi:DNA-binding transcriptional regulator of glucitol operon